MKVGREQIIRFRMQRNWPTKEWRPTTESPQGFLPFPGMRRVRLDEWIKSGMKAEVLMTSGKSRAGKFHSQEKLQVIWGGLSPVQAAWVLEVTDGYCVVGSAGHRPFSFPEVVTLRRQWFLWKSNEKYGPSPDKGIGVPTTNPHFVCNLGDP